MIIDNQSMPSITLKSYILKLIKSPSNTLPFISILYELEIFLTRKNSFRGLITHILKFDAVGGIPNLLINTSNTKECAGLESNSAITSNSNIGIVSVTSKGKTSTLSYESKHPYLSLLIFHRYSLTTFYFWTILNKFTRFTTLKVTNFLQHVPL